MRSTRLKRCATTSSQVDGFCSWSTDARDEGVRKWQNRIDPVWTRIAGGSHLNRPITSLIENGGFGIDRLDTGYLPRPKFMAFMYEGSARPN